jgi:formate dehydrogenase assembly factor FdhD
MVQKGGDVRRRTAGRAISRPTGLAIRFADAANVTLAALVRGESGNVYCHPHRISPTQLQE